MDGVVEHLILITSWPLLIIFTLDRLQPECLIALNILHVVGPYVYCHNLQSALWFWRENHIWVKFSCFRETSSGTGVGVKALPTVGHPPNVKIHESGRNTLYCKRGNALETRGHMCLEGKTNYSVVSSSVTQWPPCIKISSDKIVEILLWRLRNWRVYSL